MKKKGFRSGRSCSEQILTLKNIIEQSCEFNQKVFINFVDFKKAFDSIHRELVWKIAKIYGIPEKYINIFKNLYLNSRCCIRTNSGHTDYFNIMTGVRQGWIISPLLFLLTIDVADTMTKSMNMIDMLIEYSIFIPSYRTRQKNQLCDVQLINSNHSKDYKTNIDHF